MSLQPLAQQELIAPTARRRLIVPSGHAAWFGVDPGSRRVALAYVASDGRRGAATASFAESEGGARLAEIWRETRRFVVEGLVSGGWPCPGLVLVEQPSGAQPNPALSYATGVIQAAVFDAVFEATGYDVRVETCASGWWKKLACGHGGLQKPTKKKLGRSPTWRDYGVVVWARANGYDGFSWDEADAWGIAEAARREVALEER